MKPFFLIIFCFLLIRCQSGNTETDNLENHEIVLKSEKLLTIPIDSETPVSPYYIQSLVLNGKPTLLVLNHVANRIQYYSIRDGELTNSITINKEGPESIENINGIYHHNEDSIFVFERYKPNFLIVNLDGEVLNSESFSHPKNGSNFFNSFGNYSNPNIFLNNKVYFTENDLMIRPNEVGFFKNYKSEYYYDLKNKEAGVVDDIKFPRVYHQYAWPNYFMYYKSKLGDHLIYSFPASNNLFYYNLSEHTIDTVFAGSKYFEEFDNPYIEDIELSSDKFDDFDLNYFSFGKVLTDEKSGYVYRLVKHPVDRGINKPTYHDSKYSVIVIDSAQQKVGEYLLDDNTYSPYLSFILESSLYFSNHSIYNDTLSEDYMVFTEFKLNK